MAVSIRELLPIKSPAEDLELETSQGTDGVTVNTLFEGVTDKADNRGILARKVSGNDLEEFAARPGGAVDTNLIEGTFNSATGVHSGKAFNHTDKEQARAEDAEAILDNKITAERERAEFVEDGLEHRKAEVIWRSNRPLSEAEVGMSLGLVSSAI